MINLQNIIYSIVAKIYEYTDLLPVPTDNIGNRPAYPFLSYKVTTSYIEPTNQGNYSKKAIGSLDDRFDYDIEETLEQQPTFTLSINAYSGDIFECQKEIKKVYDWFKFVGSEDLSSVNVVAVNIQAITDRTLLIVDNYEYRYGFDIVLRTTDTIKRRINTIENYSIEEVKE